MSKWSRLWERALQPLLSFRLSLTQMRKSHREGSLRVRLLLFSLVTILLLTIALTGLFVTRTTRILRARVAADVHGGVEQGTQQLQIFLDNREQLLTNLMSDPVLIGLANEEELAQNSRMDFETFVTTALQVEPWVRNVAVLTASRISYEWKPMLRGEGSEAHFQFVRQRLDSVPSSGAAIVFFGDIHFDWQDDLILIKRQIRVKGVPIPGSYVLLFMDPAKVHEVLFESKLKTYRQKTSLAAITRDGVVNLFKPKENGEDDALLSATFSTWEDIKSYGNGYLLEGSNLEGTPLGVVVYSWTRLLDEEIEAYIYFSLITGGVAALAISVVTWLFLDKTMDPLHRLSTSLREVEKGDLSVEVRTLTDDELGRLSRNFNRMVGRLRHSSHRLKALLSISRILSGELNLMVALREMAFDVYEGLNWSGGECARLRIHLVEPLEEGGADTCCVSVSAPNSKSNVGGVDAGDRSQLVVDTWWANFPPLEREGFLPVAAGVEMRDGAVLCPLTSKSRTLGHLLIEGRAAMLDPDDLEFLNGLVMSLVSALENMFLVQEQLEAEARSGKARLKEMGKLAIYLGDKMGNPLFILQLAAEEIRDLAEGAEEVEDIAHHCAQMDKAILALRSELKLLDRFKIHAPGYSLHEGVLAGDKKAS